MSPLKLLSWSKRLIAPVAILSESKWLMAPAGLMSELNAQLLRPIEP